MFPPMGLLAPVLVSVAVPAPVLVKPSENAVAIDISSPAVNEEVAVNFIADSLFNKEEPFQASSVIINSVLFAIGTKNTNENESSSMLIRVSAISPFSKTVWENSFVFVKSNIKNRITFKEVEK
ncbi:hypothetical protein BXQ17_11820 [Polaribacter sp. BM10]|nr:hypothetical protein BXQ17_11820 [Polaribacter sp. BM10]